MAPSVLRVHPRPTLRLTAFAALLVSTTAPAQTHRPALSGYVSVANDYRLRGLSQTDGGAALQLGIDYQHASGFFVGGRASNVNYGAERESERPRKIEADYYAGYDYRRGAWSWTATLTRYDYPNHTADYDYDEVSGTVGFKERLFYGAAWTTNLNSRGNSALHQELGVTWPLARHLELSGTLGRLESDYLEGGAYMHWDVGISKVLGRLSLDLRHYENNYTRAYSYLGDPAGGHWVVTLSYGLLATP
jgi:uncharacterized protein (TIGR02001 family)